LRCSTAERSDGTHLYGVRQFVAVEPEAAAESCHFLGGWRHPDLRRRHLELDGGAVGDVSADFDLGDTARMRQHEFDFVISRYAQVTGFGVQRCAVECGLGLLPVDQKRFAHMGKRDFFEVVERLDGRVFAGSTALPGPEQRRQRVQIGMQVGRHSVSLVR
jgi:hypothetical protein